MMEGIRSTGGAIVVYIRSLIGTYTPLTDQNGDVITTSAGIDYEYLIQAILLIMTIYFIFKFITLAIKR